MILSLNHHRLPKLAEFIYANLPFASHVAWMGMETTGLARQNLDRVWVAPFDYRDDLEAACRYLYRRMIPSLVQPPPVYPAKIALDIGQKVDFRMEKRVFSRMPVLCRKVLLLRLFRIGRPHPQSSCTPEPVNCSSWVTRFGVA